MINKQLLSPTGIVVVGGSNNLSKPGGRILQNLLAGGFTGNLYVVNPRDKKVQGTDALPDINDLPQVDLAILAIGARQCPAAVRTLAEKKEPGHLSSFPPDSARTARKANSSKRRSRIS